MIRVPSVKSADQLVNMITHAISDGSFYVSLSKLGTCHLCTNLREEPVMYSCAYNCDVQLGMTDCVVMIYFYSCYPKIAFCIPYITTLDI